MVYVKYSSPSYLNLLFTSFIIVTNCCDISHDEWYTDPESRIADVGPCNIEIRGSDLTNQEFLEKYAFTSPVILKDVTDNTEFQQLTSRQRLLSDYADKNIILSTANTHSYEKVTVTLRKYIETLMKPQSLGSYGNETYYWFGDNDHKDWHTLFKHYKRPPFRIPGKTGVISYGVAGAGTGVPFHFHGAGFAEVIHGRKRWFMYPPDQAPVFHPDKSTLHWLIHDYPSLVGSRKPLECTIQHGEVIYFPDRWWHATLNIDTSVFISTFLG